MVGGLLLGIIIGAILVWFILQWRFQRRLSTERDHRIASDSTASSLQEQLMRMQQDLQVSQSDLRRETAARAAADARVVEIARHAEEQQTLLTEAKQKFIDAFKALSDDALKSNNQAFLQLAKQTFSTVAADIKGDLGQRQEAIKGLVKPLEQALKQYAEQMNVLEKDRAEAHGELREQIASLARAEERIQEQAENLVSALRLPQVRGRWGEMTLRRVVELSGMSEHCDFVEQPPIDTAEARRLRPDLVIHLPAHREVVVDAKTPLSAYLTAIELPEDQRDLALREHATQLRAHMTNLSSKAYWNQFPQAPEYVVMFIPGESFFSAALRFDKTLIEDGIANRVVLATPTTIIALLRAIAYGWRQEHLARNAQEIAEIGKQTYGRFKTFVEHMLKLRADMEQSIYSFNRMVGSLEGRILPGIRKFRELGATAEEELPSIERVEQSPRHLMMDEGTAGIASHTEQAVSSPPREHD